MELLAELTPALLALAGLVIASAFFSGTEVAMFSLRRVDREQMARSTNKTDKLLMRLLRRPRHLISTILMGNETVNVSVSAVMAGVGGRVFAGRTEAAITMLTTLATLPLLLFLGEITPKTVAIKSPVRWARAAARPLWIFGAIVTPLRLVVQAIANVIVRPFGGSRAPAKKALGEAEFRALVDAGSAEGQINARERRLIHRVFEFGDKNVSRVMVPVGDVFALAYDLPLSRIIREISVRGFSRVPVYHRSRDNIVGLLYAKDLVVHSTGLTAPRRLSELLHEPLFIPRRMALEQLFRLFKARKTHLALVVNEYGKLEGLVTMEDLLEELFGEIRDEKEMRRPRNKSTEDPDAAAAPHRALTAPGVGNVIATDPEESKADAVPPAREESS